VSSIGGYSFRKAKWLLCERNYPTSKNVEVGDGFSNSAQDANGGHRERSVMAG
jgi:hypothetical protein